MSDPNIILNTAPGEAPQITTDLTDYAEIAETTPRDNDAKAPNFLGMVNRYKRTMQRRFSVKMMGATDAIIDKLLLLEHERTRVMMNSLFRSDMNHESSAVLYNHFSRPIPDTLLPGYIIGVDPTFTRTSPDPDCFATQYNADTGLYESVADGTPRYERCHPSSNLYPSKGIRLFGTTSQYWGKTHPRNGDLVWTNTGGTWTFDANVPGMIADYSDGTGFFVGNSGDYIGFNLASMGGPVSHSSGVWVKGYGTVTYYISNVVGGPLETAQTELKGDEWTLLKHENWDQAGTVNFRLYARSSGCMVSVSHHQLEGNPRLTNPIHNVSGTAQTIPEDQLFYDIHPPSTPGFIHAVVEMPPTLYAQGYQYLFSLASAANEYCIRYNGAAAKMEFLKKGGTPVQWTPTITAGRTGIISVYYNGAGFQVYENSVAVATLSYANGLTVGTGLYVGHSEYNDIYGWNGLLLALFITNGPGDILDALIDVGHIQKMYSDSDTRYWTRRAEGRLFEIKALKNTKRAGINHTGFTLDEVRSYIQATSEEY